MGRRPYLTRLILGRSAYDPPVREGQRTTSPETDKPANGGGSYVQQYDDRGHPINLASRFEVREARRAQNDVLSTVGVCEGVDENGNLVSGVRVLKASRTAENRKIALIMAENEVGLLLSIASSVLMVLVDSIPQSVRYKLETFRSLGSLSMSEIITYEWRHAGLLHMVLTGLPAATMYLILYHGGSSLLSAILQRLESRLLEKINPTRHEGKIKTAFRCLRSTCKVAMFVLAAPLSMYSVTQRLGLIPATPVLPHPMSLIPFTSRSPFQLHALPTNLHLRTLLGFAGSFALSPLPLLMALEPLDEDLGHLIKHYLRKSVPQSDNPDAYSIKAASLDSIEEYTVPSLLGMKDPDDYKYRDQASTYGAMKRDIGALIQQVRTRCSSWLHRNYSDTNMHNETYQSPAIPADANISPPFSSLETSFQPVYSDGQLLQPNITHEIDVPHPSATPPHPISRRVRTPTRSASPSPPSTSSSSSSSLALNATISIEPRNSSTDTIHMNVRPSTNLNSNRVRSSSPANGNHLMHRRPSHNQTKFPTEPHHRVTVLTDYPTSILCTHLSENITCLLLLPLETLFIRSVALGFLAAATSSPTRQVAASRLKGDVYPLNSWFGMGLRNGWRGMLGYAGSMTLCLGLQTVMGMGFWQVGSTVAWWCGTRRFGWGRL